MEAWVKGVGFTGDLPAPIDGAKSVVQIRRRTERPKETARNRKGKSKKGFKGKKTTHRPSGRTTVTGGQYHVVEETVYIITSLPSASVSYEDLYWLTRDHWFIENKLHWVRDTTLREDASRIRTGNSPRFMATLNNLGISAIRIARGVNANIQAATEHCAANLRHVLALFRPLIE
jgi:predicted transposase YbfD/YdcC